MNNLEQIGSRAKQASGVLCSLSSKRNQALAEVASSLLRESSAILKANQHDLAEAEEKGTPASILDRISLNEERIREISCGVEKIIELEDPLGEVLDQRTLNSGILLKKIRVPLGVIGIIYEARPNITVDASALALKTGNAIILRGSSSALESNREIVRVMQAAMQRADLPVAAIQLVEDTSHETASSLLKLNKYIDVIIPRGSGKLIQKVLQESNIPVIETGEGNCHIYVDESANLSMAKDIVINAKTQRPSVCNAAENLLIHSSWPVENTRALLQALLDKNVECRACERSMELVPGLKQATEEDYATEFLDFIIAVKILDKLDEAIDHINTYGTRHSEAILTENQENAEKFQQQVDAAAVYHNASTRFTDGFMYGFGAEIGISTQKLHARGPMGLPELTSYKYVLTGKGQIRA